MFVPVPSVQNKAYPLAGTPAAAASPSARVGFAPPGHCLPSQEGQNLMSQPLQAHLSQLAASKRMPAQLTTEGAPQALASGTEQSRRSHPLSQLMPSSSLQNTYRDSAQANPALGQTVQAQARPPLAQSAGFMAVS